LIKEQNELFEQLRNDHQKEIDELNEKLTETKNTL